MIKILVIEENVYQAKQIINYLSQNNSNIKLYGIAYSGQEAIELIRKQGADIILIDLKLIEINGVDIIKQIERENLTKYKKSIIIISGEYNRIEEIKNSEYVYSFFLKPLNFELLEKDINIIENNVRKENMEAIKNKINKELEKLNFKFMYKGTKYLADIILIMYMSKEEEKDCLSQTVYPILATKYKKTENTIYGNIKQSINCMFYDCDEKT